MSTAVSEPIVGQFRTALAEAQCPLRLVRRYGGTGLGDRRRGHADLFDDRLSPAGLPDPFRRHHLRRQSDARRDQAADGAIWKNSIVTDEKREDRADARPNFAASGNTTCSIEHVTELNAVCPTFYQWDDHEVLNNWSPSTDLRDDGRYIGKVGPAARGSAPAGHFHEMTPIRYVPAGAGRVYRKISYGPLLDVLLRRPALLSRTEQPRARRGDDGRFAASLASGRSPGSSVNWPAPVATWKVIACDLPIGLVIWDDYGKAAGQRGRCRTATTARRSDASCEFADLLRFIRDAGISNMVWLTADVHYTAAHYYDPGKAKFQDFLPFWEFVAGPLAFGHLTGRSSST